MSGGAPGARPELGPALRRWRDRLSPEAAGLCAGGRRRAPGLRREELARLAGISLDYVTRLEQGRAAAPSGQVVEALARALRLAGDERASLFGLAGLALPGPEAVPSYVPPGVLRLLDRLAGTPAAVTDAALTLLVANPLYRALTGDMSRSRGFERNGAWQVFLGASGRFRHTRAQEAGLVRDLRAAADRYPADPRLRRLISTLRTDSERFAELWEADVTGGPDLSRTTIEHPQVGLMTLDRTVLRLDGTGLRVLGYSAEPGTEDAEKLRLLAVIGTQSMAAG
ncbi:helix-turn-helix transcriptional regulator [Streptomyces sp. 4F14]|uniref:helix-turn-helix transcriptional regulator n=1 Tax=Streptomyces sp. 4F14 TaxID=3394380 RepID=UPI003A8543AD